MENQAGRSRQQGAPVADGRPRVPRRPIVVMAVDEDLYKVPSNDVRRKKGRGVRISFALLYLEHCFMKKSAV
jgi:hypothetical protein